MMCDRHALPVDDLVEAERFYGDVLTEIVGGYLANRYGLTTEELLQARKAAALAARRGYRQQAEAMALPFSRVILGVPAQAHVYLCLADRHLQEAPPDQLRGTPRLAIAATPDQLARAATVLATHGVRFEGPVHYAQPSPIASALYFRDPSGNFLEFCCPQG